VTIVMKFGGSSIADAASMRQVARLIADRIDAGPLVVLSAMGKTTDALFDAARLAEDDQLDAALDIAATLRGQHGEVTDLLFDGATPPDLSSLIEELFARTEVLLRGVAILRELSPRSLDAITSHGELMATRMLAFFLPTQGHVVEWFDARDALRTDRRFGQARPDLQHLQKCAREHLAPRLRSGAAVITQGYIGATQDGLTTTLGRGGSDYSAALFGAALGADEVQIWTDVEGVMTCDPRVVPQARPIDHIGFVEAAELAAFGARVLHPATIQPAVEASVPVTVRHTFRPDGRFTTITQTPADGRMVTALAARGPITVLTVTSSRMLEQSGYLARLFEIFGRLEISVDLVATAEVSVSLSVDADVPMSPLLEELAKIATVDVARDRAIVSVIGERLKTRPRMPARIFSTLDDLEVEMISLGANEINLSMVVKQSDADEALRRLHRGLIEQRGTQ